ncbi:transcription/translation regulatory transformer protein RfaH [Rosenbergiella australiborealis]|uniref:Transcription antitermination protein RfaH n=1 Tax=Rosenbergiella australiborealis TaxID=1544696 RepID=A0ABS5T5H6_9GAMM|nr:transcription/translation regulatory transformer protein RfaH [Rosenbergiella australiborealis]MBT0727597.1 transcription/translation regulatory transformer protein RfaH [Rosenbergiella australiborealis]
MADWYLLYCKRGQLTRAKEHLERQQVICFVPMIETEKVIRAKATKVCEPLFPNYLFLQFDPNVIHTTTISATRGVSHFVRFGSTPARVPEQVITQLRSCPAESSLPFTLPQTGEPVTITRGIFEGMSAIYQETDGETRSFLLLNLLNKTVVRSVENDAFSKA